MMVQVLYLEYMANLCIIWQTLYFVLQIPGNMQGFNSKNETIDLPPVEIMPPVLKGLRDARGMLYYTVTGKYLIYASLVSGKQYLNLNPNTVLSSGEHANMKCILVLLNKLRCRTHF